MATRQNLWALILLNAFSAFAYLGWLGYQWLRAMGSAFSNSSSSGEVVNLMLTIVGLATVACAVGSFFAPGDSGKVLAVVPILLILLAQGYISHRKSENSRRLAREQAVRRSARNKKLERLTKDYLSSGDGPEDIAAYEFSFLSHDRELNTIVAVDVQVETLAMTPVGKIDGASLDTLQSRAEVEKLYKGFLDKEGKSIFDRYTVRHRPDLDRKEFHLEKYER